MVITIHKLPVGSFTFLQCLSGTELPNLSGTPYKSTAPSSNAVRIAVVRAGCTGGAASLSVIIHLLPKQVYAILSSDILRYRLSHMYLG
jgi:hypothetical protein